MNRYLFILIAAFASSIVNAQSPAYVVQENGDTLRGFVKLISGFANAPQVISLGATENSVGKDYSVVNCRAFGMDDADYYRVTVTMDMSFYEALDQSVLYQDSTLTETIFIKRIYKGKNLSLYKYYDGNEIRFVRNTNIKTHFFVEDKQKVQELIMKYTNPPNFGKSFSIKIEDKGSRATRELRPIFRNQLLTFFDWMNETRLKNRIDASEYREDVLLKLVAEIDKKFNPLVTE